MRYTFLFICLLSLSVLSLAQIPERTFFQNYSTSDGLPSNWVKTIAQDSVGFVWVGTLNGLTRFDGSNWELYQTSPSDSFSLSSNDIVDILIDQSGKVWVGTQDGLNIYDSENERFLNYKNSNLDLLEAHSGYVEQMTMDAEGNIWLVNYSNKLYKIDPNDLSFEEFASPPYAKETASFSSVYCEGGVVWLASKRGAWKFASGQFVHLDYAEFKDLEMWTIHFHNDRLFVGANGMWVVDMNSDSVQFLETRFERSGLPSANVLGIERDKEGSLVFVSDGGGLHYYNPASGELFHYSDLGYCNLSSRGGWSIFIDRDENLWYGQFHDGLDFGSLQNSVISYMSILDIEKSGSAKGSVHSVTESPTGELFVSVDGGGLFKAQDVNSSFEGYTLDDGLSQNKVITTTIYKDSLAWLSTYGGGVFQLDLYTDSIRSLDLIDPIAAFDLSMLFPRAVYQVENRLFSASIGYGCSMLDLETGEFVKYDHIAEEEGPGNWIESVEIDDDQDLWLGAFNGIYCWDTESLQMKKYDIMRAGRESKDRNSVMAIFPQGKTIWIGTSHGLVKLDKESGEFVRYEEKDGLDYVSIYTISADQQGIVWMGTSNGLVKFNPKTDKFSHLKATRKGTVTAFEMGRSITTRDNLILMPANKELAVINPKNWTFNSQPPKIYLKSVELGKKVVRFNPYGDPVKEALLLPYKEREIAFEYGAIIMDRPEHTQFAVKLVGFDEEWREPSAKTRSEFLNLEPGEYTFLIKAQNADGVWSEEFEAVSFYVPTPWWQAMVFRLSVVLFVLVAAYAYYRYRLLRITRDNQLLERKVSERTIQLEERNEQIMKVNNKLEVQNDLIVHQKNQIEEGIMVGSMVQNSALPEKSLLDQYFAQSFVLYEPKDIISGDFYFIQKKGNLFYLAAGDCTGHGVAGGLLTMIAINSLSESVNQDLALSPGQLLDNLHRHLLRTTGYSKDQFGRVGIDMAICVLDTSTNSMSYASAKSKLFHQTSKNIEVLKADRRSVGVLHNDPDFKFSTHHLKYRKGDRFFLMSDGLQDQLNKISNDQRERFGSRRIKKIIADEATSDLSSLGDEFKLRLNAWRGELVQTDDVLMIGLEI